MTQQILGSEKSQAIENATQSVISESVEKLNTQENKELCIQLNNDLKPVVSDLEEMVQDLQSTIE